MPLGPPHDKRPWAFLDGLKSDLIEKYAYERQTLGDLLKHWSIKDTGRARSLHQWAESNVKNFWSNFKTRK